MSVFFFCISIRTDSDVDFSSAEIIRHVKPFKSLRVIPINISSWRNITSCRKVTEELRQALCRDLDAKMRSQWQLKVWYKESLDKYHGYGYSNHCESIYV